MPTVSVSGLSKSYGPVRALRGLTVDFPEGPVGLLGPNGAGKSTLLKVLLGFLEPEEGTARVLDWDVGSDPLEVRRAVGYMPEVDAYLPGLTGVDAVVFCGALCGMPRREAGRRAHEILYYVGLEEARYRKVEHYSTGMRQRLRLAQALVHDPELIFLDEPTNGLDPSGRDEILALIDDLAREHRKNVVLCSHLLRDVEAVCEHVVVLRHGEVALHGPIKDVLRLEPGLFTVRVTGDVGRFADELDDHGVTLLGPDGEGHSVRVPDPDDPRPVFAAAAAAGCAVRELRRAEDTLEGVFVRAVEASHESTSARTDGAGA